MSDYTNWYVGMKVVHVPAKGSRLSIKDKSVLGRAQLPSLGQVYTIRTITDHGDVVLIRVDELRNDHLGFRNEPGFNTSGWVPYREKTTDISIFHSILNGHRISEDA